MAQDGWGAPRIHAELTKLGFVVSEMTVSRYMPRCRAEPDEVKRWIAFLRNHKDDIAAMDLFAVPTASLRLLYGFFRHRARPSPYLALQRDVQPHVSVGDSTTARGVPIRHGTTILGL